MSTGSLEVEKHWVGLWCEIISKFNTLNILTLRDKYVQINCLPNEQWMSRKYASPFSTRTALYLYCRFKWVSYKLTVIVYCLNLLYQCNFHHCDKNYKDTWHRGKKSITTTYWWFDQSSQQVQISKGLCTIMLQALENTIRHLMF